MKTTEGFLLDTCAIVWLANDQPVSADVRALLDSIDPASDPLVASVMSAWEIGMLISKGRLPTAKPAVAWFEEFVSSVGIRIIEASPDILIASSFLPQPVRNDPVDRIVIATARQNDLTIITRDRAILAYGAAGHVRTLAC
ncbi:type II toxin-antitoxin system VapC family toxin [Rhizobium puerariae]|uniref:Type II toxin-antitoxin system VapC family toxin n=1 Tax=Rhizobium puerariae TaxID=1585791 RepID=A0ABV6AMA6_9HYPH